MIVLDLDGVLVDFGQSLLDHSNSRIKKRSDWPVGEYDLCKATGLTKFELNHVLDGPEVWLYAEPLPWAHDLIALMDRLGGFIATQPWKGSRHCVAAKSECILRHFGQEVLDRTCFLPDKIGKLAHEGVLIDDYDANCTRWMGKWSYLFPMPWNKNHDLDPWDYVNMIEVDLC